MPFLDKRPQAPPTHSSTIDDSSQLITVDAVIHSAEFLVAMRDVIKTGVECKIYAAIQVGVWGGRQLIRD